MGTLAGSIKAAPVVGSLQMLSLWLSNEYRKVLRADTGNRKLGYSWEITASQRKQSMGKGDTLVSKIMVQPRKAECGPVCVGHVVTFF